MRMRGMRRQRTVLGLGIVLLAALVLTGCSASPLEAELDRPQEPVDVLPPADADAVDLDLDEDSTRFVTEADGVAYYVGDTQPPLGPCLVIVADGEAFSGCGGPGGVTMTGIGFPETVLAYDEYDKPGGTWHKGFLWIRD